MDASKVQRIIFFSLLLDLMAFTMPLPLFPRIIEWYTSREAGDPNGFMSKTLSAVGYVRGLLVGEPAEHIKRRWDVVLLGGLLGSLFSTFQFIVAPHIGSLSDKHGRKTILLLTMVGNILSAAVWIQSTSFGSFMLARAIGGLSEGNVQLAIAIISDVTTPATRAKGLASIGIAFAVCFCIGPPLGAWFATRFHTPSAQIIGGLELNVYAVPAFITLVLLLAETAYIYVALPETRGTRQAAQNQVKENGTAKDASPRRASTLEGRLHLLQKLRQTHFMFLATFSGVEFTLTFLSFDLFDWNNIQNGRLLGFIGILSTILQGGYVRRKMSAVGEGVMARRGIASCAIGLLLLTALPKFAQSDRNLAIKMMYGAAACLAFTSATVVNALTSYASLQCDEEGSEANKQLAKGRALGEFRSSGQLGRAIGPIAACAMYWIVGPSTTYAISAALQVALVLSMGSLSS